MSSPPSLDTVRVRVEDDAIAIITYHRPHVLNALNYAMIGDILQALRWAEGQPSIRILIITGQGRLYTAGMDLSDSRSRTPDPQKISRAWDELSQIHEILIQTDKIVISAVNGPASGWGVSSVALSDLVYAVPDAFFFTPFVKWGLCAEACASVTFAQIMGRQKASALVFAGARLSAQELESAGLITKILPKEDFFSSVMDIVRQIARLPPQSLKINKRLMMRSYREQLLEANRNEIAMLRELSMGEETKVATAEFAKLQAERKAAKL